MAEIKGLTLPTFTEIVQRVSEQRYAGNVIVDPDAHPLSSRTFRARVMVKDSRGQGARRSWSGRRMRAACWHVVRDVYAEVFRQYPQAVMVTRMARYNGVNGFLDNYPGTAHDNIGSIMEPAYMPELCDCDYDIRYADVNLTRSTEPMPVTRSRAKRPRPVPHVPQVVRHVPALVTRPERDPRQSIVDDIDAVLAEVAADGWTNPYTDPASPARRLA